MSPRFLTVMLFALLAIMATACSRDNPTTLPGNIDEQSSSEGIHQDWGSYALEFDPEKGEAGIVFDREESIHVDVTGYLYPPACGGGGCVQASFVGWDPINYIADIDVTLINPTPWSASDVRMIFYNLFGKAIVNPDSYTKSFVGTIEPFIAFSKFTPNRIFPGSGAVTEKVRIYWPPGSSFFIYFKVSAWLWISCTDPYEINNMFQDGELTMPGGLARIGCDVLDWQDDVKWVVVDTTPLTGGLTNLSHTVGNTWDAWISNSMGSPPGDYKCLIGAASPNPQNFLLYNYIILTVSKPTWHHEINWTLPIEPCTLDFAIVPSYGVMGYAFVAGNDIEGRCNSIWMYQGWGTFPYLYATFVDLDPTNPDFQPWPPVRIDAAKDWSLGWTNSNPASWPPFSVLPNNHTYCNMDNRPGFIWAPESDDHRHYFNVPGGGPSLLPLDCCDTPELYQCTLYGSDAPTVPYVAFQGIMGKPEFDYTDMDIRWEALFPFDYVGYGPGKVDPMDVVAIDAQMLVDSPVIFVYILEKSQSEVEVFTITDTGPGPYDSVTHWLWFPIVNAAGEKLKPVDCELLMPNSGYMPAPNVPILNVAIYNDVLPPPSYGGYINIYNSLDGSFIEQIGDSYIPAVRNEPVFLDTEDYMYEIHVMQKGAVVDMFKYY